MDNAVGYNNSRVQVSVIMDFQIDEKSEETYERVADPISEEIITEETLNDSGDVLNTKSNTVANYEMNKTITRIIKPVGVIETVNVAALINKKFKISASKVKIRISLSFKYFLFSSKQQREDVTMLDLVSLLNNDCQ